MKKPSSDKPGKVYTSADLPGVYTSINEYIRFLDHHNHMSKTTTPKTYPAEVISFTRGDNLATIATNGMRHVSQEFECVKEHSSLKTAIAYLEAKGYKIDTSNFQSI